jgi:hypothetical protein
MGSSYLQSGEYAAYGVAGSTTAAQVTAASALVDAYLDRPEGCIWSPDWAGLPCYMAAASSTFSFIAQGAIAPGVNVPVALTNGINLTDRIGEAVILDRANTGLVEACAIVAAAPNSVTLGNVTKNHASSCTLELGLTINEERSLPARRSITRVAARPLTRLLAGAGRFGYGRRSDQAAGTFYDTNIMAMMLPFGGPPAWVPFDPAQASISSATNEIWVPPGLLYNANFSEVRLSYIAGFSQGALPSCIKSATALAINAAASFPEITGNIKMARAGDTAVERFRDSILDTDTRAQLAAFKSLAFA